MRNLVRKLAEPKSNNIHFAILIGTLVLGAIVTLLAVGARVRTISTDVRGTARVERARPLRSNGDLFVGAGSGPDDTRITATDPGDD